MKKNKFMGLEKGTAFFYAGLLNFSATFIFLIGGQDQLAFLFSILTLICGLMAFREK